MSVFVSPNEPPELRLHFTQSNIPEQHGMDFMVASKMGMIGIQRKTIDDFLSSVRDGRLTSQTIKSTGVPIKIMVIEGEVFATNDGNMMTNWSTDISTDQFAKMLLTVTLEGYTIWRTTDMQETIRFVEIVNEWGRKERHSTIGQRGGPERDPWGQTSEDKVAVHFLQGLPGIGQTTAKNLFEHWGVPMVWTISINELKDVPGIGKHRAKVLSEFLNGDMY